MLVTGLDISEVGVMVGDSIGMEVEMSVTGWEKNQKAKRPMPMPRIEIRKMDIGRPRLFS